MRMTVIIGFQDQRDAQRFRVDLKERMEKFALSLNEGKTRLIEFGRYANERRKKRRAKLSLSTFWVLRTFAARQAQGSDKSCAELSGSGEMRSSRQSASNYAIDVKNR